jgi:hypothetical protein
MRIDFTFEFDKSGPSLPAIPSRLMDLPPVLRESGGQDPATYVLEGAGTIQPLNDTRGDMHGGLWDAAYRAIIDVGPELLALGRDVAIGILAHYLYDRAKKGHVHKITANQRTVTVNITVIRAAIEETTMTLKQRFDNFCEQFSGSEPIDSLQNPPNGVQKGDFLFEGRTIVCENKCLEENMEDKLLDGLREDGIDPDTLPKGRHVIEDLYLKLPKKAKGKNRYKKLIKRITTSVEDAIKDAANQIPDTKKHLGIPDADGILVILNEEVNIIGQPLVSERLGIAFKTKQRNKEGQPYHSAVTRILHIGETNAVVTRAGDIRVNTLITNPHAKQVHDVDAFVNKLAKAWAEYNGHTFHEPGSEIAELMENSKLYIDVP